MSVINNFYQLWYCLFSFTVSIVTTIRIEFHCRNLKDNGILTVKNSITCLHNYLIDRFYFLLFASKILKHGRSVCCYNSQLCKFRIMWYVYWNGHVNTSVDPGKSF